MTSKCFFFECKYNNAVMKQRSLRRKRSHGKIGRKESVQVSGRCVLGAFKRNNLCEFEEAS